jgi:hypothetical protein
VPILLLGGYASGTRGFNYKSMSLSLAPGGASLQVHMENTLQPARRLVARLLEANANFFCEYHYLDPLGVDDSDNPLL